MRGSLRIGRFAGIGVYIHWTFALLVAYVLYRAYSAGATTPQALQELALILTIFVCVVLHEFGHALTAGRFGVKTRDITLLPIGGVARLERMPEKPIEEFWVAIAGPAVNVAIAAVLFLILAITGTYTPLPATSADVERYLTDFSFLEQLLVVNLLLVAFNMLPAFPMDGGRILRAALAAKMGYARGTSVAATVGQVMAVLFALAGIFTGNWMLLLIAGFVFLGAQAERQAARTKGVFEGIPVSEAMVTDFRTLPATATLADASAALLAGAQQDFPVVDDGRVVGVLPRADLFKALASGGPDTGVAAVMRRDCRAVSASEPLTRVFETMQQTACPLVPVLHQGRLVGIVTPENIGELFMLRSAVRGRPDAPPPQPDPYTSPS